MKNYPLKPLQRPNYLINRIYPSKDSKKVLKLALELKVLNEQTNYIKSHSLKKADLENVLTKKLNII